MLTYIPAMKIMTWKICDIEMVRERCYGVYFSHKVMMIKHISSRDCLSDFHVALTLHILGMTKLPRG